MRFIKYILAVVGLFAMQSSFAKSQLPETPILVIGASFAEGKTPFNNGVAPLGGVAVKFGSYLSLSQALIRHPKLPGFVISEAQGGATTFARSYCAAGAATCGPAGWDSYETQMQRALSRVGKPPTFTEYNAEYVVIVKPNDCLHSDAFGIPQSEAQPCTLSDMNANIDRLIAVGNLAISKGLTPIFDVYPRYEDLDLEFFRTTYGLQWVISEADYNQYRTLTKTRMKAELPTAVVLDMWGDFTHIGDGIHPDYATVENAADIIVAYLKKKHK